MTLIELAARRTAAQFAKDPGKYRKTHGPDIEKALHLRSEAAQQDKPDVDFAAPFRAKIEQMASRLEAECEAVKNLPPELRPDNHKN